jgi:hypothetical protein
MLPNLFLSSESCVSEFRPAALCRPPVFFAVTLLPHAEPFPDDPACQATGGAVFRQENRTSRLPNRSPYQENCLTAQSMP